LAFASSSIEVIGTEAQPVISDAISSAMTKVKRVFNFIPGLPSQNTVALEACFARKN
jgi:hypothetical protein